MNKCDSLRITLTNMGVCMSHDPSATYGLSSKFTASLRLLQDPNYEDRRSKQRMFNDFNHILNQLITGTIFPDDGVSVDKLVEHFHLAHFQRITNKVHGALLATIHLFGLLHYLASCGPLDSEATTMGAHMVEMITKEFAVEELQKHSKRAAEALTEKLLKFYIRNTSDTKELKKFLLGSLQNSLLLSAQGDSLAGQALAVIMDIYRRKNNTVTDETITDILKKKNFSNIDAYNAVWSDKINFSKDILRFVTKFCQEFRINLSEVNFHFSMKALYLISGAMTAPNKQNPVAGLNILAEMWFILGYITMFVFPIAACVISVPASELYLTRLMLVSGLALSLYTLLATQAKKCLSNDAASFISLCSIPLVVFLLSLRDPDWAWVKLAGFSVLSLVTAMIGMVVKVVPPILMAAVPAIVLRFSLFEAPASAVLTTAEVLLIIMMAAFVGMIDSWMMKKGNFYQEENNNIMNQYLDDMLASMSAMRFLPHYTFVPEQKAAGRAQLVPDGMIAVRQYGAEEASENCSPVRSGPKIKTRSAPEGGGGSKDVETNDTEQNAGQLPPGYYPIANMYGLLTFASEIRRKGNGLPTNEALAPFVAMAQRGALALYLRKNGMKKRNSFAPELSFKARERNKGTRHEARLLARLAAVVSTADGAQRPVYEVGAIVFGSH